jgi:hypothetical protein
MGEKRNVYMLDMGRKARRKETKTQVGDNIKMDFVEIGWGGVDWITMTQDRDKWRAFVNVVRKLKVS